MALVPVECAYCGVTFLVKAYRLDKGRGKFCSRRCSARHTFTGKRSGNWRGGRIDLDGYVLVRSDDVGANYRRGNVRYGLEHRLVMASHLGRPLSSKEIVHHINGNKSDNKLENLRVMTQGNHARSHLQKLTPSRVDQIKLLRQSGVPVADIASQLSLSLSSVYRGMVK